MEECELKHALIVDPGLIEEGLVFKGREVDLSGKRCDLLFTDKEGRDLYVEVKVKVSDSAYGQIARYAYLADDPDARFMLAGLSFVDGLKEVLANNYFEYCELDRRAVKSLLERLRMIADLELQKKKSGVRKEKAAEPIRKRKIVAEQQEASKPDMQQKRKKREQNGKNQAFKVKSRLQEEKLERGLPLEEIVWLQHLTQLEFKSKLTKLEERIEGIRKQRDGSGASVL
ncbi:MAG: endonuclease NucS [Bacillus sp. (in: Bacteria)]|nr:endonuclease NucS [Bacillus sp. (in: firmicutes)]